MIPNKRVKLKLIRKRVIFLIKYQRRLQNQIQIFRNSTKLILELMMLSILDTKTKLISKYFFIQIPEK